MCAIATKICDDIFKEGNIIKSYEGFTGDGIYFQSYIVEYLGEIYTMTKNNGEWVYFYH